jgi:hypothetical protein
MNLRWGRLSVDSRSFHKAHHIEPFLSGRRAYVFTPGSISQAPEVTRFNSGNSFSHRETNDFSAGVARKFLNPKSCLVEMSCLFLFDSERWQGTSRWRGRYFACTPSNQRNLRFDRTRFPRPGSNWCSKVNLSGASFQREDL